MTLLNFWQLLAGLSLFLYGLFHLEDSLKELEGRSFKLFLKKHTKNKLSAIFSGTLVTTVLQSSSIVNLMVLSFVGAGILSMRNALGVVLGANIGGTFNSWLVALLGFKVELGAATLPIIGIAGIGMMIFKNKKNYFNVCKFILGFGLLFMGLNFMKLSMDRAIANFDFKPYLSYHKIVFLLIGFVITSLIQTSAGTVVIVLSALNAKIIPIETAVAVILGAELGTTMKIVIGSIGGIAAKKRVALGNTLFNLISSLFGFLFLGFIVAFLQDNIGIKDPLIVLVSFQTLVNVVGAILFYFFLNHLADILDKSFLEKEKFATIYLQNASLEMSDASTEILEKEVGVFIQRVILINEEIFLLDQIKGKKRDDKLNNYLFQENLTLIEKYNVLKRAEGEMLLFYTHLTDDNVDKKGLRRAYRLLNAVRSALYAAKSLKDIIQDVKNFSNSSSELKYNRFKDFQIEISTFNSALTEILCNGDQTKAAEQLNSLLQKVEKDYKIDIINTYQIVSKGALSELDISTVFNLNREIFDSCKAMILATKDYLLTESEADIFENKSSI